MDRITIYDNEGNYISKTKCSPFYKALYDKADKIFIELIQKYKYQKHSIELRVDENSNNINCKFYNCTKKFANDFQDKFSGK